MTATFMSRTPLRPSARAPPKEEGALSVNIAVYLIGYAPCLVLFQVTKTGSEVLGISKGISRCLDPRYETASRLIFFALS